MAVKSFCRKQNEPTTFITIRKIRNDSVNSSSILHKRLGKMLVQASKTLWWACLGHSNGINQAWTTPKNTLISSLSGWLLAVKRIFPFYNDIKGSTRLGRHQRWPVLFFAATGPGNWTWKCKSIFWLTINIMRKPMSKTQAASCSVCVTDWLPEFLGNGGFPEKMEQLQRSVYFVPLAVGGITAM